MAKIEDLIAQIPDERLPKGIAAEVKALKKTKKFGLVFEEHLPETVRLPRVAMKPGDLVDRVERGGSDKPWHLLINADNFHALQLLLYCYEGKVDVIYIDPPYHDKGYPNQAKLELFAVLNEPETLPAMERLAKQMFDALWRQHKTDIQQRPIATRKRFHSLIQAAGEAALHTWELPGVIVEKKEGDVWKQHLYCDAKGGFSAKLNGWEKKSCSRKR